MEEYIKKEFESWARSLSTQALQSIDTCVFNDIISDVIRYREDLNKRDWIAEGDWFMKESCLGIYLYRADFLYSPGSGYENIADCTVIVIQKSEIHLSSEETVNLSELRAAKKIEPNVPEEIIKNYMQLQSEIVNQWSSFAQTAYNMVK